MASHLIIPIFIPHMGCPHRCIFCNQRSISGKAAQIPSPEWIRDEVDRFLHFQKKPVSAAQISFFGGNFLGLPEHTIHTLLETVQPFVKGGDVESLRFSTRPDTVNRNTLDAVSKFPVATVELGVQSMDDGVLCASQRGHRAADTVNAVELLKESGFEVGLQMMVGLPEDNESIALKTAFQMAGLNPDFVRIYPTVVLKESQLAERFRNGRYRPMELKACVTLVKQIYLLFKRRQIPVIRMGLQASDGLTPAKELIAGPYHPAFGHLVLSEIVYDTIASELEKTVVRKDRMVLACHPAMVSRVQGLEKENIRRIKKGFKLETVELVQNPKQPMDQLLVQDRRVRLP